MTDEEWDAEANGNSGYVHFFIEHDEIHTIYWGGEKLAALEHHQDKWEESDILQYTLTLAPNMERRVFEMLGIGSAAYSRYVVHENERRAYLVGQGLVVANLHVEVIEIETYAKSVISGCLSRW